MRGYVYLDAGMNLEVRSESYIDQEDPGYFQRNRHLILLVWKFDSDNEGRMYDVLDSFQRKQIPLRVVQEFCAKIGFNLPAFMAKHAKVKLAFPQQSEI